MTIAASNLVSAPPPDWSAITETIRCPLCDYDLRGLIEPRCPECGYQFVWPEVLDAGSPVASVFVRASSGTQNLVVRS